MNKQELITALESLSYEVVLWNECLILNNALNRQWRKQYMVYFTPELELRVKAKGKAANVPEAIKYKLAIQDWINSQTGLLEPVEWWGCKYKCSDSQWSNVFRMPILVPKEEAIKDEFID